VKVVERLLELDFVMLAVNFLLNFLAIQHHPNSMLYDLDSLSANESKGRKKK
jgi:hypothetical protein